MKKENNLEFSDYTKNMYMGNKSSLWSKFNLLRVNIVLKYLSKINTEGKNILEIGSYDLFFINYCLEKGLLTKSNSIDFSDLYNEISDEIIVKTNNNFQKIQLKYSNINFNKITQYLENVKLSKKYDFIFIFETLEHTTDEKQCIENLSKLLNKGGKIFISVPLEHGLLFFIKDLGRKIILGERTNTVKEMFYGLFSKTDKIERVIGTHKGYDYRKTKKHLIGKGFKMVKQSFYPFYFSFLGYGVVWEFKK